MNEFFESAVLTILTIAMDYMAYYFLYKVIGFKKWVKRIHIFKLIVSNLVITTILPRTFYSLMHYDIESSPNGFAMWQTFLFWYGKVVFIALVMIYYDGRKRDRLLYSVVASSVVSFYNSMVHFVLLFTYYFRGPIGLIERHLFFPLIACILIYITFRLLIHIDKKSKLHMPQKYWNVAFISFFVILIINHILLNYIPWDFLLYMILLGVVIGLFLIWAVLYFAFYFVCRYYTHLNESNLVAMQNEMLEKHMLQKQDSDRMLKILSHDLRHNLGRLKLMAEQSGDEQAIKDLAEYDSLLEENRLFDVGNDYANSVINEKKLAAMRKDIIFTVKGGFTESLTLSNIDICSLLGNLLDNALEAAEQVDEPSLRMVKLEIKRKGNMLLLSLENGCFGEPLTKDGTFVTKKKSTGLHGIGTISINNIVEKYNGVIEYAYQNDVFKADIMLQGYM